MKQSSEYTNEWSCMNCGLLVLSLTEAEQEVQDLSVELKRPSEGSHNKSRGHGPKLPGEESISARVKRLQIESLEDPVESEDSEGDDIEWKRLNP